MAAENIKIETAPQYSRDNGLSQGGGKICKAVHQYSKGKISSENMDVLMEIGHGCMVTRNYIYQRYGGIKSLVKVYSGYEVDSEVRAARFREKIGLPSVYFSASVSRALADIKIMWAQVRNGINDAVSRNERFSSEDRHYIRFALKTDVCYWNILNGKSAPLPEKIQYGYEKVIADLDGGSGQRVKNLNRYICRQTRKRLHRQHTDNGLRFTIKKQGYKYGELDGEHGIFLATKANRQRMFIPLTDANVYDRMLDISLNPQKKSIEIIIPIFVNIMQHEDYADEIGISLGLWDMITTSTGNVYGSSFGKMQQEISRFILEKNYRKEIENASDTQKYQARKEKMDAALKNYVNMELNRMLAQEKPKVVYMAKLPRNPGMLMKGTGDTHLLRMWKKGFVTERLQWKCQKNGIKIVEVIGRGIGRECSACGQTGYTDGDKFICPACGFEENKKVNGAKNALNRGKSGKQLNRKWSNDTPGR
ncbi:MAG: transposase [Lachnospiraceae bacterium]|nr:transposase [Lachnospiraceae bacterium]